MAKRRTKSKKAPSRRSGALTRDGFRLRIRRPSTTTLTPVAIRARPRQRATRVIVEPKIYKRPAPQRSGSVLRTAVHPNECAVRQNYKKTMMRKLAAQKSGSSRRRWRQKLVRTPKGAIKC